MKLNFFFSCIFGEEGALLICTGTAAPLIWQRPAQSVSEACVCSSLEPPNAIDHCGLFYFPGLGSTLSFAFFAFTSFSISGLPGREQGQRSWMVSLWAWLGKEEALIRPMNCPGRGYCYMLASTYWRPDRTKKKRQNKRTRKRPQQMILLSHQLWGPLL